MEQGRRRQTPGKVGQGRKTFGLEENGTRDKASNYLKEKGGWEKASNYLREERWNKGGDVRPQESGTRPKNVRS